MSKEIVSIHIDLSNTKQLNESFLEMFGSTIKLILQRMFGQDVFLPPVSVTGDRNQVETFAKVLAGERRYFDSYVNYGLNDPRTYRNKYELESAVSNFERATNIKWPFK
jgi:hypothetical protein